MKRKSQHEMFDNPLNIHEGTLDVHVHQIKGVIADTAEVFLTLQVDYLGGFFTRVFTSDIAKMNKDLIFDQKFELSLNCSQTLRINAYKRIPSTFQDFQFFAMGTFELQRPTIGDQYCLVTVPLIPADSRLHLIMSVRLYSHEFTENKWTVLDSANDDVLRLWRMRGKVFGQCIKDVLKREERKIPLIVTSCIKEIEERGLDSSFIYVMRGDDTRVNDLVAVFDICSFTASYYIKQARYTPYDIAEVLTRYLRSLPHSILLCPNNYLPVFTLEDTTVKVRMVAFLLTNIPEPGRSVFSYLLDHMAKVCLNEPRNRVTPTIMGGIFSPVILDSDVTLTLEEYMRKRNHFASILKCMIELKLQGYKLDNTQT
ncbi:active breakpoint cluster region-related protein-like [Octopus sinensis]|uniref:Active breakpoint cluster region-related protein-like n=1 Tax=Octopus sinensis TaxID=2607531 RepID=A0A7E6EVJ4_9MOLL|nr:active breakpoint cluster region-related protein-like [Octopus sinensis]